jgi:pyruvate/2-oxoglutarate dehydrogenase complex dihydrolipoamide acyltransferase (E2) component
VGEPGEAIPDAPSPVAAQAPAAASPKPVAPVAVAPAPAVTWAPAAATAVASASRDDVRLRISPRASRLAADSGIDPRTITGTGPEGRITERDVQAALAARSAVAAPAAPAPVAPPPAAPASPPPPPPPPPRGGPGPGVSIRQWKMGNGKSKTAEK